MSKREQSLLCLLLIRTGRFSFAIINSPSIHPSSRPSLPPPVTAPGGPFAPLARARIPFSPPEPRFLPPFPFWRRTLSKPCPYLSGAPRLSFATGDPAAAAATKAPAPPPLRQPGRPVPIWLITALPGHEQQQQQQLPPPPPLEQGASSPAVARRSAAHTNKQSPARARARAE